MELLQEALSPWNIAFTALLGLVGVYWALVIAGLADADWLGVDVPDPGADLAGDVDVGAPGVGGVGRAVLSLFFVGELPVVAVLSVWVLSLWTLGMLGQHYLNPARSLMPGALLLAGNLLVSVGVVRLVGRPLKAMYALFNRDANDPGPVIGRICKVTTSKVSNRLGQAQIETAGAPILLNVVVENSRTLHKGDEAVIVSWDPTKGVYVIAPVELEA